MITLTADKSTIDSRLKDAEAFLATRPRPVLSQVDMLRQEKDYWEGRLNTAQQAMHAITKKADLWSNSERYTAQLGDIPARAREFAQMLAEADLWRDVISAATAKLSRVKLEMDGLPPEQDPRIRRFRTAKVALYDAWERLSSLGSVGFASRDPDWQRRFDEANEQVTVLSRELESLADVADAEDLQAAIRSGDHGANNAGF